MSRQYASDDGKAYVGIGVTSVDCAARGECAASGGYVDSGFNFLVFAAGQHAGRWARAGVVPGDASLVGNGGVAGGDQMWGDPFLSQVSCSSAGNCALAGNYQDAATSQTRPLVASERGGRWGPVHPVRQATAVLAVSCPPAAGYCAAGGLRTPPATTHGGAFVISQKDGVWGSAQPVAGTREPVTAMSCPAAGDCLAGGPGYLSGEGSSGGGIGAAFLASERDGQWGHARPVPGLSRLTGQRHRSSVDSVDCVTGGECTVGGSYTDASGRMEAFVVAERRGVWGRAQPVPGLAALNKGGQARVTQVSCTAAGSCAAGGWYRSRRHRQFQQAWVASETGGRWGTAVPVPGTARLNTAGIAGVTSVSCAAAGCAAGGWYTTGGTQHAHAFLVTERRGRWGTAAQPPGLAGLNTGNDAWITSVSCAPVGWCTAVGNYTNRNPFEIRMFVISQR